MGQLRPNVAPGATGSKAPKAAISALAPKVPAHDAPRLPADRQRNGGAEDVTGIVVPLGGDQPVGIGTIALCQTVQVVSDKEVRISTRKRHRSEGLTSGSSPLAMPLLLFLVRPIDEGGEDLDEHVVAAEAKGCCLRRYARGGASGL